ncbi:unnamed protein product [Sphenostylis stenocarpa]|uniref:Bidirectional sugar transporter SWEET n=1 Tax=Sphenostylis stenocarpa TaxID=92480 RepID=A0AA86STC1_9FABA|nr:unnamed protein product [Sphenostylis stenocarpa]
MSLFAAYSICEVAKDAAGVAGNVFAFGLFVSPIATFRRIIRNGSTEMFSGMPFIYSLLNCLICMWYGTPLISADNLLVTTVNSIGAVFQFVYIILFLMYAEKAKKVRMIGLLVAVLGVFAIILFGSLQINDILTRQFFVGFLSCASLISMFASPLFIIKLVIQTKSVEFMPFYLSLSTFLMSTSFFLYGLFNDDAFIYVPNGIGTVLGMIQLILYFYYENKSRESSREPLIVSYATLDSDGGLLAIFTREPGMEYVARLTWYIHARLEEVNNVLRWTIARKHTPAVVGHGLS